MLKTLTLALAVSFIGSAALAAPLPAVDYTLNKDKSAMKFFAIENGAPVAGKFKDFDATIHFSPDDLLHSSIQGTVKVGSFEVANDDVAQNLRLPDWLSVDAFPTATFKSTKISRMPGSDNYYAEGDLTLRGKTLPVTMNFQMERLSDHDAIASGYITLSRLRFGVGQGQWAKDDVIKDEVRVEFRIAADKK